MIKISSAKFLASYASADQLPPSNSTSNTSTTSGTATTSGTPSPSSTPSKPEVVFVGRSNVGKSTLLNKLCNNKNLAKVSSKPGKTTTINFFDAGSVYLVDLPGYGFAARSKSEKRGWSNLIDAYFSQGRNIQAVYMLLDNRHMPSDLDLQMISYLKDLQLPFEIHFTKQDKLSKQQAANMQRKILSTL